MLQYFDTLTDDSGNSLLGATVAVTNYPSGSPATIYSSNGTTQPIANSTVVADITGQVSFYAPDGAYTLTYAYKGTQYKVRSPVQFLDPMGFVAAADGGGAANAYAVTGAQYPAQKYVGLKLEVLAAHTNTGNSVLTYQGDAGFPITQPGGSSLVPGMIQANGYTRLEWDGVEWQLVGAQSQPFYATTTAETAAAAALSVSTVVINSAYQPGDLRRYGADTTNTNLSDTAILYGMTAAAQSGGIGYILHPGGTIKFQNQITLINGVSIIGYDRAGCVFNFVGTPSGSPASTRSAIRYQGVAPWSGYANISLRHFKILYANQVNFAAAIELNGWGWAYWEVDDVWIAGNCSFGLILDGTELCSVHNCLIENLNPVVNYQIWLVNGADRGFTQGQGFTNTNWIRDCQISGGSGSYGIADDGGNAHMIEANNFNQNAIALVMAGVTNAVVQANSFESLLTSGTGAGPACVLITTVSANQGVPVGGCRGVVWQGNGFYGNINGGTALMTFAQGALRSISNVVVVNSTTVTITFSTVSTVNPFITGDQLYVTGVGGATQINGTAPWITAIGGSSGAWTVTGTVQSTAGWGAYTSGGQASTYHRGQTITSNSFGARVGRGAAIDVTGLANSVAKNNVDESISTSFTHYTGVHTDNQGNELWPPQNGFIGTVNLVGPTYGDTRYRTVWNTALQEVYAGVTYSASMTFDLGTANCFEINATNGTAFTINSPTNANQGNRFTVRVKNTSGGALGAVTWGPSFKLAAWVSPATANSRSIVFEVDGAGLSVEVARTPNDVPN